MGIQITTLDNGVRVVSDTVPTVESVSVGIWVNAGARHEAAPQNGIAHLLEHMVFKGTSRRSALDIAREIETVGGQMNAYTGREHTAFYAKVATRTVRTVTSPLDKLGLFRPAEISPDG